MSRNKKKNAGQVMSNGARVVVLVVMIAGASLGYVWQKDKIRMLGQEIKEAEMRHSALVSENQVRRDQLAVMWTQNFINRQIETLKLGLVEAQPSQIWRLPEPTLAPETAEASEYALHLKQRSKP